MTELQRSLFELQDLKYRDFQSKLLPKTEKEKIIGVRTPILRKFAKEFAQTKEAQKFLQELPHQYYEENNLHLMLVTQIRDYKKCLKEVTQFLPYIDNWATCDLPLPKCFEKHKAELIVDVKNWIASNDTYTIRYGIGVLRISETCLSCDFGRILCQYDDCLVFCNCACKAMGGCDWISKRPKAA